VCTRQKQPDPISQPKEGACAIDPIQSADTVYPIPQPRSPSPERTPPPQNHRTKGSRTRAREKVKELRTSAGQKLRDGAEGECLHRLSRGTTFTEQSSGLAKIMTTRGHTSGPDVASDEKPHPTFASDGIMHVGRRSRQPRNAKREEDDSPVKPGDCLFKVVLFACIYSLRQPRGPTVQQI
jgi:hypothetical protein